MLPATAEAISESGDSIAILAARIGLEPQSWQKWLTHPDKIVLDGSAGDFLGPAAAALCPGQHFKIPNLVLAYWGGELQGFGKQFVGYDEDCAVLSKRGFDVEKAALWTAANLETYIQTNTSSKLLHGVFMWGHGSPEGMGTNTTNGKTKADPLNYSLFSDWNPAYKLSLGVFFACDIGDNNGTVSTVMAYGGAAPAILWDNKGMLVPGPFHSFAPKMAKIVPPGAQGTQP